MAQNFEKLFLFRENHFGLNFTVAEIFESLIFISKVFILYLISISFVNLCDFYKCDIFLAVNGYILECVKIILVKRCLFFKFCAKKLRLMKIVALDWR